MTEEKFAGNRMLCFRCQSEIKEELRPFEIKFELGTCKWFLYKMQRKREPLSSLFLYPRTDLLVSC